MHAYGLKRMLFAFTLILLLSLSLILSACQQPESESILQRIASDKIPENVNSFMNRLITRSGIFLYNTSGSATYLYLDGYPAALGEPTFMFTEVNADVQEQKLLIYVSDKQTADNTVGPDIRVLYKIAVNQDYDTILLFRNGSPVPFTAIGN